MEDERNTADHDQVEVKDRGILDTLLGRNKQPEADQQANKQEEDELATGMMDKVTVADPAADDKHGDHHNNKLHHSSDEEEEVIDEKGEIVKRRNKKGLKDKIKDKLTGGGGHQQEHGAAQGQADHHTPAPVETHAHYKQEDEHKAPYVPAPAPPPPAVETHVHHHDHATVVQKVEDPPAPEEEKKGLLDKIKEKLPGAHKKPEDAPAAHAPHAEDVMSSPDGKEKDLLGKIMDKIPGYNKAFGDEDHKPAGAAAAAAAAGDHKTTTS